MNICEYKQYKLISDKILDILINENFSSPKDIKIIYNIIMDFPYCLDVDGHYTYNGEFYNSLAELPDEAKKQIYETSKVICEQFVRISP
jgi:hypothetical protein